MSSWEAWLFEFSYFVVLFLLLGFSRYFYAIFVLTLIKFYDFSNTFFPLAAFLFIVLFLLLAKKLFFSLMESHLFILFFLWPEL